MVIPHVISDVDLLKVLPIEMIFNVTEKKSNASHVHARKPTKKNAT
jgi:hypothetical protein